MEARTEAAVGVTPVSPRNSESGRGDWIRTSDPLRPSGPERRFYATSCEQRSSFKPLVQCKMRSQVMAGDSVKALHECNPNATLRTAFLADSTAMTPCA